MKVAVLGAGAWGSALAIALSVRHSVALWARDAARARAISDAHENSRYLPRAKLPSAVEVTAGLEQVLAHADLSIFAAPTDALRATLETVVRINPSVPLVWACKGLESETARLPHQVADELLGPNARTGVLSGPSFALEVAQGLPTALTLASRDGGFASEIARELHQPKLRVYFSTDVVGVEVAGAIKNVMAIAAGICDGLDLGLNARAALITRGLAEISRLGVDLGGRAETFMGLAGAGDLILTCTGDLSRNRRVGLMLAKRGNLPEILQALGHVAEGVNSAREAMRIAAKRGIDMPITQSVCGVLFSGVDPRKAVQDLLARDPKQEHQGTRH